MANTGLSYRALAAILASIYIFTMLKPVIPVIHYSINFGVYANELCENKDKPELHCNGTCALAKKLNLNSEKPDKPILPQFETLEWYIAVIETDNDQIAFKSKSQLVISSYKLKIQGIALEIPTPPPIIV